MHILRSDINEPSTSESGIFPAVCTLCGSVSKSRGKRKRGVLGACETNSAEAAIKDAALKLEDDEMLAKISGIDLKAKKMKYHHSCKRTYLNRAKAHSKKTDVKLSSHQRSFNLLKKHIDQKLLQMMAQSI